MTIPLLIGTYTEPILHGTGEVLVGRGEGVYSIELDSTTGRFGAPSVVARTRNPSFLCRSVDRQFIYLVNELKQFDGKPQGSVSAFGRDGREICVRPTGGTDPCHVALTPDGKLLSVANFMSGSVCAYPVNDDGSLSKDEQFFQYEGCSADPQRQAGPHPHSTAFGSTGIAYVPDLGLDLIHIFAYSPESGLVEQVPFHARPGSGPRYCEFGAASPTVLYCVNELNSTVDTLDVTSNGTLELRSTAATLPSEFDGHSICGTMHVAPDGKHVYASNRGHDSIAIFDVASDGALTQRAVIPSGGKTPRDFTVTPDQRFLVVAHQDSDNVVSFAIAEDGGLDQRDEVAIPTPVCVICEV